MLKIRNVALIKVDLHIEFYKHVNETSPNERKLNTDYFKVVSRMIRSMVLTKITTKASKGGKFLWEGSSPEELPISLWPFCARYGNLERVALHPWLNNSTRYRV